MNRAAQELDSESQGVLRLTEEHGYYNAFKGQILEGVDFGKSVFEEQILSQLEPACANLSQFEPT